MRTILEILLPWILFILFLSLVAWCKPVRAYGPAMIETRFDTIPNYAVSHTMQSVKDGEWNDGSTWDTGGVPSANDVVVVLHHVTAHGGEAETIGVFDGGRLDLDGTFIITTLLVIKGTLQINQPATVIFRDQPIDTAWDPEYYGHGLLVVDGESIIRGEEKTPWVQLAEEARAGDTVLTLTHAPNNWHSGDELIIPDTRMISNVATPDDLHWERVIIKSVNSENNRQVLLTKPLQFDHKGARDHTGQLRYLAHVGNLTRSIQFKSENPNGIRGHTMATRASRIDWRWASFESLGRTTNGDIDNTMIDKTGRVLYLGSNQIARYPIHLHQNYNRPDPVEEGCYFLLDGLVVDGGENVLDWKWGITIHATSHGCIRRNLVFDTSGAGIGFEDGNEQNLVENNFVVLVRGTGLRADRGCGQTCGHEGAAYWFRGGFNRVRNNIAANSPDRTCYTIFQQGRGLTYFADVPGMDPYLPGMGHHESIYAKPLAQFENNLCYGMSGTAITLWSVGTEGLSWPEVTERSSIKGLIAWHALALANITYASASVTFQNAVALADPFVVADKKTIGFNAQDYFNCDLIIDGLEMRGYTWGVLLPHMQYPKNQYDPARCGTFILRNATLSNWKDIVWQYAWHNANPDGVRPAHHDLDSIRFEPYSWPGRTPNGMESAIYMDSGFKNFANITTKQEIHIRNYQQIPGLNFRVYHRQQDPNAIMQATKKNDRGKIVFRGAPIAGLTNAQAWEQYGVTTGGELAPCTDTASYPEIEGIVCQESGDVFPPHPPIGLRLGL